MRREVGESGSAEWMRGKGVIRKISRVVELKKKRETKRVYRSVWEGDEGDEKY